MGNADTPRYFFASNTPSEGNREQRRHSAPDGRQTLRPRHSWWWSRSNRERPPGRGRRYE
jgi:hypothetical protein